MHHQEDEHWWFKSRRHILKEVIKSLPRNQNLTILEAGCGTGGNLKMLRDFGKLYACEMDDNARGIASARGVCPVSFGVLPGNVQFDSQFDLVCLFDVLEHVQEDKESIRELSKQLRNGGSLLITVPAHQFLWSSHDIYLHHKRRYSMETIKHLVEQEGLTIRYLSYFNTFLFPCVVGYRLLNKVLRFGMQSDNGTPSRFVNKVLYFIFSSERWLLPRFKLPFGLSIICIATASNTPQRSQK